MNIKHNLSKTPEYKTWLGMKTRCYKSTNRSNSYINKGITVCDRWLNDFHQFYLDMGPKPTRSHSLDRIDNDKGYCPENCRWATHSQQSCNRSVRRKLSHEQVYCIRGMIDEGLKVKDIATHFGVTRETISSIKSGRSWVN